MRKLNTRRKLEVELQNCRIIEVKMTKRMGKVGASWVQLYDNYITFSSSLVKINSNLIFTMV